jgi:branched-chain amino acid transport system ATP-binding protein
LTLDKSPIVETRNLTKVFGGITAVDEVNFTLSDTGLRAIIGPNGAGKTTFVKLISGVLAPTRGRVYFMGEDITRLAPHVISRKGIAYTFQLTNVFTHFSVLENILLATQRHHMNGFRKLRSPFRSETIERSYEVLKQIGLEQHASVLAGHLPHGDKRLLEIGIAIALDPKLLLLDEPTQGMNESEIKRAVELIGNLSKEKYLIMIAHDMRVVMKLASQITVFNGGHIIAEGTPTEISHNHQVLKIYLGTP